jgi:hypothetical protein
VKHIVTIQEAKDGWVHANCSCGWHAQTRTVMTAKNISDGHMKRHSGINRYGKRVADVTEAMTKFSMAAKQPVAVPTVVGQTKKEALSAGKVDVLRSASASVQPQGGTKEGQPLGGLSGFNKAEAAQKTGQKVGSKVGVNPTDD